MQRRFKRWWRVGLVGLFVVINVQWVQGQQLNTDVSPIATPGVTATPTVISPVATPEPTATEQWIQPIGTGTPYPTAIQLLRFTAR